MKRLVPLGGVLCAAVAVTIVAPSAFAATDGWQSQNLFDPIMRMNAYTVTYPEGWKMEGMVVAGDGCSNDPFPVYRAYALDGLTELRRLPRFDWGNSTSQVANSVLAKCPQISTEISARDFLKYVAHLTNADSVRDWPLPAAQQSAFMASIDQTNARYEPAGMHGYSMRGDVGANRSIIHNGTFEVEQQLNVTMICTRNPLMGGGFVNACNAQVRCIRAPKGKLDGVINLIENHTGAGAAENPQWRQALNQALAAQNQAIMRQRAAAFQQWSDVMAHNHQQFMQQMQSEAQSRTDQFHARIAAKDTATSDWVDYALNQQTVTGSGGTAKVSSAYTNTWSNGNGQWFQTNDPNANPNAALGGNWTRQTVTHGNGTPY